MLPRRTATLPPTPFGDLSTEAPFMSQHAGVERRRGVGVKVWRGDRHSLVGAAIRKLKIVLLYDIFVPLLVQQSRQVLDWLFPNEVQDGLKLHEIRDHLLLRRDKVSAEELHITRCCEYLIKLLVG